MGGNAFRAIVPDATFPRMPPPVYNALKAALLPRLQPLYAHVTVPREAPEKADFGDLDFLTYGPREGLTPDEVKAALRATHSVPMDGPRTSNFAIAMDAFEDVSRACRDHAAAAAGFPSASEADVFFQVDVHVCADREQFERTAFYNSYGDLGLMLGLLVQTAGLSLGHYGLKLAEPIGSPLQTYYLSSSTSDILSFMGLDMARWERGFASQTELFEWVATSPLAQPFAARLKSGEAKPSSKERGDGRPMREAFIRFLKQRDFSEHTSESVFAQLGDKERKLGAALRHFGKAEEYAAILDAARAAVRAKAVLNGKTVNEWTGVTGMPARFVLDEMKERLATRFASDKAFTAGDVPAWQRALLYMSDEEVRELMVRVKEELDAAGKLVFDWRTAKAARLERKKQKEAEVNGAGDVEVAVAVEA